MATPQLHVAGRPARQRNRRGEGAHLRDEIIAGASAILERTGSEENLTLRAVAREVGIAAPSISHLRVSHPRPAWRGCPWPPRTDPRVASTPGQVHSERCRPSHPG